MKQTIKSALIATAAASLALTAFAACSDTGTKTDDQKVKCSGVNECKGKGACKGDGHECTGKNTCKGKGWVEKANAKECTDGKGTVVK